MIYFILDQASHAAKIGVSSHPERRLRNLQIGTPSPLVLAHVIDGDAKMERALHRRFAASRVRGEWYRWDGEVKRYAADFPAYQRPIKAPDPDDVAGLRQWRRSAGKTLADLAAACRTTHASMSRIERGAQTPSLPIAVKLEDITGIPARSFLPKGRGL